MTESNSVFEQVGHQVARVFREIQDHDILTQFEDGHDSQVCRICLSTRRNPPSARVGSSPVGQSSDCQDIANKVGVPDDEEIGNVYISQEVFAAMVGHPEAQVVGVGYDLSLRAVKVLLEGGEFPESTEMISVISSHFYTAKEIAEIQGRGVSHVDKDRCGS